MAAEFNSQQSQVMLNVSENHRSSPAPKERERAVIEGSPAIEQQNQDEALEPNAAERVEDSYHESIPKQAIPDGAHYDDDNDQDDGDGEDDLYAVSPREKTRLRQAVDLPRVSQTKEKPAAPLSRNPIDALLDEGAVLANELQHAQPSKLGTVNNEGSSDLTNGYPPVNVTVTNIDVRPEAPVMRSSKHDAGDAEVRMTEQIEHGEQMNPQCTESMASQAWHSIPDAAVTDAIAAHDAQNDAAGGAGKIARQHSHSQSAASVNQKRPEKNMTTTDEGNAGPSPTEKASKTRNVDKASENQKPFAPTTQPSDQSKVLKRSSQRKAKQSALAKLKARKESTSDEFEDDSQGDASAKAVRPERAKPKANPSIHPRKIPSTGTNDPASKQSGIRSSQGKLKSVKPTLPAAPKQALTASGNVNMKVLSNAKSRAKASCDASVDHGGSTQPTSKSSKSQNSSSNQQGAHAAHSSQERHSRRNQGMSSQRAGALKRPARGRSRERSSQRESLYEISDHSPKKKRSRKMSKAPAVSQKAGLARQKMQSESVKKRTARSRERSKQNLVSMPPLSTVPKTITSQNTGMNNSRGQENNGPPRQSPKNDDLTRDGEADDHLDFLDGDVHREAQDRVPPDELAANLVDDHCSDAPSDIEEGPAPVPSHTNEASRQTVRGRLQTPVMLPSSPPRSLNGTNNTRISDKPTIIAFSKHGPRNQGQLSIVEVPDSTAPIRHTLVRGTPATTFAVASDPSATPLNARNQRDRMQQSNAAEGIPQANVSTGNEDVFSAFTKNGKNFTLAGMPEPSKPKQQASKRSPSKLHQVQEHDQFAEIDDYEGTTLVYDDGFQMAEAAPRTASQIAMPPPQKGDGAPVKIRKIFDGSVITAPSNGPESRDPLENSQAIRSNKTQLVRQKPTSQSLRTIVTAASDWSDQTYENGAVEATRKSSKPNKVPQVTKNAIACQEPLFPDETSARPLDPVKRPIRRSDRPSHRTKHDSQGVDILGSPYPKGLEVPRQATALEVFSMQSGLSSDMDFASDAIADRQLDFAAAPKMRSSTGVGRVSSSGKAVPIAPQEDSKVVSAIASGALAQELLAADSAQSPIGNPFVDTSTGKATNGLEEFGKGLEKALLQHQTVAEQKMAEVTHESQGGNDPDETLVETLSERDASPQHVVEPPASKHTSRTSSEDAAAKVLEDVGDWRNTLKPHQTHLFDSLVVASHKLVRHIVDKETAQRDIIADYRRRGDIIVHELQSAHRREYEQYQKNMQDWKRQAADKLVRYGDQLKQEAKKAERARAEREKLKRSWIPVENAFEELLAGLD